MLTAIGNHCVILLFIKHEKNFHEGWFRGSLFSSPQKLILDHHSPERNKRLWEVLQDEGPEQLPWQARIVEQSIRELGHTHTWDLTM